MKWRMEGSYWDSLFRRRCIGFYGDFAELTRLNGSSRWLHRPYKKLQTHLEPCRALKESKKSWGRPYGIHMSPSRACRDPMKPTEDLTELIRAHKDHRNGLSPSFQRPQKKLRIWVGYAEEVNLQFFFFLPSWCSAIEKVQLAYNFFFLFYRRGISTYTF